MRKRSKKAVIDVDPLFDAAYAELRRLAAALNRGEFHARLSPTTLVHEAWCKLSASPPLAGVSESHFKRIAARAMRQLLIEAARRRKAEKRGGDAALVTFDEGLPASDARPDDVLRLEDALCALAKLSPRQAEAVHYRFFGGLTIAECAEALEVSEETIQRDWRVARAWLADEIRR